MGLEIFPKLVWILDMSFVPVCVCVQEEPADSSPIGTALRTAAVLARSCNRAFNRDDMPVAGAIRRAGAFGGNTLRSRPWLNR